MTGANQAPVWLPGQSDDAYPGVVRKLAPNLRLIVSLDGRRYRLQPRLVVDGKPTWVGLPNLVGNSLAALQARAGELLADHRQSLEGVPDDPAAARPDLTELAEKIRLANVPVYEALRSSKAAEQRKRAADKRKIARLASRR